MESFREFRAWRLPGIIVAIFEACVLVALIIGYPHDLPAALWILAMLAFATRGFFVVQPNDSRVVTLFGRYIGTVSVSGLHWTYPVVARRSISRRVRNFTSQQLKVNDASGNPVEIAAVVVWRVVDTARACFDVDDYTTFVETQAETAIRALAGSHPYDGSPGQVTLLGDQEVISTDLIHHLQTRLQIAGVEVLEARLAHLAYAPEIAQAMLRRQQASAIVAARQTIVEGAVGMVHEALNGFIRGGMVELDAERRASMVNNLMVVLASDQATHPIVNTGTLYG